MLCFFFSSRRRHTRYIGDWSSDVCSSDLWSRALVVQAARDQLLAGAALAVDQDRRRLAPRQLADQIAESARALGLSDELRSEERRVGKECGARWAGECYQDNRWRVYVMRG